MSSPRQRGDRSRGRGRGRGWGSGRGGHIGGGHGPSIVNSAQRSARSDHLIQSDPQEFNQDLPERFGRGKGPKNRPMNIPWTSDRQNDYLDITLNKDIREYVRVQNNLMPSSDEEAWISSPEIPSCNEIQVSPDALIKLLPNKPSKPFKTISKYLKTHYALMREDAVGSLREAVDQFRQTPTMNDDKNMSIYEKVHTCGFTFTNMGIAARVKFSTTRAGRRILWPASKRLVSGSLVALTPASDLFETSCIVAIVAARPLDRLEQSPPEIDIYFSRPEDICIDPQVEYVMIESKKGYFEAYRHTLLAFQKLSSESFPFRSHITGLDLEIDPPRYLSEQPRRSLVAAIDNVDGHTDSFSSVDIVHNWPEAPDESTLDQSQWMALERILTKKLAIIQGPPGTGKTHISKVALEIMVQNRAPDDPPIIIAAQTNHALDQLLMHVSKFDTDYIRLGGRSTNADVKKHALFEIKQNESIPPVPGSLFGPARNKLKREVTKYGDLLSIFDEAVELIPIDKLFQLGIVTSAQQKSLVDAAKNWITTGDEGQTPLQYWLHNALLPFQVDYNDDNFGFEEDEVDLEIEQLREIEAEHGVADEEDIELLKGEWKAIADNWTVATPSAIDLENATHLLDTKQDLWDIPEYIRGPVYHVMKQRAKDIILKRFRQEAKEYCKIVEELKIGKWEKDAVYLRRANIIGMTTTGLSKYRPLIASLKPKIILIEEAAEVIEGPVTAACMESVEHLILVGDHQQLQGHCALQDMEGSPYFLNISMFERLVNLKMPYTTLSRQRRMNSEIRSLLASLYPNLRDHESIKTRQQPPPWGTGTVQSFFFQHEWSESKDQSLSTYNEEEARMVAKFYRHLRRHGVPAAAITILTFYNGQRKRILRELKEDPETNSAYNNVKTVDSYQGEENDIVILSLVRNNSQEQIGFLENNNRVCVSLSRARYGIFIFGNWSILGKQVKLWETVGDTMNLSKPSRMGFKLPLTCSQHDRTTFAQWPDDFDQNDGGCDLWCGSELPCGHRCLRRCHPMPHSLLPCRAPCNREVFCGHNCVRKCHEVCACDCEEFWNSPRPFNKPVESENLQGEVSHSWDLKKGITVNDDNPNQSSRLDIGGDAVKMKLSKPGPALARGGAAFQVVLTPPRTNSKNRSPGQWITVGSSAPKPVPTVAYDWTSFAEGGVQKDDKARDEARNLRHESSKANLIDFSATDDEQSMIEQSTEEKVEGNRRKFTQSFNPPVPTRFGYASRKRAEGRSDQNGDCKNVSSLLD